MNLIILLLIFSILESISLYAQNTPSWRVIGNLSEARTRHESVYIGYSKILVFGGSTNNGITDAVEVIDILNNTIEQVKPMKKSRAEFASLVTSDSLVLAIGGVDFKDNVTNSIEAYNIKTGKWTEFGSLSEPRRQFKAMWISPVEFIVVGGRTYSQQTLNTNTAEIFNIETKISRLIPDYPVSVNNPAIGYSSTGIPIIFGGREGGAGSNQSDDVYTFDLTNNKWVVVGKMPHASEHPPTIKLWDNRLLYTGGNNELMRPTSWLNDIAVEENNSFKLIGAMKFGRHAHFVSQWNSTTLLTGGGSLSSLDHPYGSKVLSSTEWIDIQTGKVTDGPPTNHPHSYQSYITIPIYQNGKPIASKIVVISGFGDDFQFESSVEILEPNLPDNPCDFNSPTFYKLPNLYSPVNEISQDGKIITTSTSMPFCPGNKLLIIQMRGAETVTEPGDSYGKIISYNTTGNYEFTRIENIAGNKITLKNPLERSYNPEGRVQIVRVPEFKNYTVTDNIICPQWDGSVFGVIAVSVSDTLTLRQSIIADGAGFSGGRASNANSIVGKHINAYYGNEDSSLYALKGNGIAGFWGNEHCSGKGAFANAGGGGNNHNAGGGGGANGGCGGMGGFGWDEMKDGNNKLAQGLGGYLTENDNNRIFMGGGGGAGHSNEKTGTDGGNGGGIIIIHSNVIVGDGGIISAKGSATKNAQYDGVGGGGGGGTIIMKTNSVFGKLQIEAGGGTGGGVTEHQDGPGGGGGGGVVCFSAFTLPWAVAVNVRGGFGGKYKLDKNYGQTDGCDGTIHTNINIQGDNSIISDINPNGQNLNKSAAVYPLPADEIVTIRLDNEYQATSCLLHDLLGNVVGYGSQTEVGNWQIDVSTVSSGVFIGIIKSNSETRMIRIVVQH